jgi:hypothetical protein
MVSLTTLQMYRNNFILYKLMIENIYIDCSFIWYLTIFNCLLVLNYIDKDN